MKRGRKEMTFARKDDAQDAGEGIVSSGYLFVRPVMNS